MVMLYGSLTEAANALCISQPAASKLLKHAEQRLGFELFKRVKGKLQPTQESYILYAEIKPIYDKVNKLQQLTENLSRNTQGQLTIGCLPSLGLSLVPKLTANYLKKNKNIFVSIGTDHTESLEQKLLQREIDLAVTFEPVMQQGIIATPILEIPLVYIDSQPLKTDQDIHAINENSWIQPDSTSLRSVVEKYRKFHKSIVNVQTYYMASELVRQGLGCSITDIFTAAYSLPKEMIHEINPKLYTTIYVLQNANMSTTKAAEDFIRMMKIDIKTFTPVLNQRL
jgi:DNA-binding transcriptional LysR family regulator